MKTPATDKTLIEHMKESAAEHERAAAALREAIAVLEGTSSGTSPKTDFRDLGIVDAAIRLLREQEPLGTGEIARELLQRGVTTDSKKFVATVYATLANSPSFERVGTGRQGQWKLKS